MNNHNSSIIKVDDSVILNHAYYRGLYLVVLSRYDLKTVYRGSFNTIKAPEHDTLFGSEIPFLYSKYKYDSFGHFEKDADDFYDIDKIYNRTSLYRNANEMAKKIREFNSSHFIIVTSQYGWESYFSEDLGRTLENCGAILIKEFTNLASARFGNFTRIYKNEFWTNEKLFKTKMFHPYAFIGIPGLPPGMAYE